MQAIRLLLIEPENMAAACEMNAAQWHCLLRDVAIQGFARHLYGPISLAAALLAWLSGFRILAMLAMAFGMAGAVLYDFELAALGLLLGALLLVQGSTRAAPVTEQHTPTQ
jgi:hypothetical protein